MTADQITAALAFERYKAALDSDGLIQGDFHSTASDGRRLACVLGVIDESVESSRDCPARVMPRWLARMVPNFFDRQCFNDAKAWGLEFYAELQRLDGQVPFSVVHDYQANVIGKAVLEYCEKRGKDPAPHLTKQALHIRALAGDNPNREEWRAALLPAFRAVYAYAYAYAKLAYADADAYTYTDAYAEADADAHAYAYAYADAKLAYADPYADADAYVYANAYAKADADLYSDAYAYTYTDAYAYAYADADPSAPATAFANGMVECLRRVPTPEAAAQS